MITLEQNVEDQAKVVSITISVIDVLFKLLRQRRCYHSVTKQEDANQFQQHPLIFSSFGGGYEGTLTISL